MRVSNGIESSVSGRGRARRGWTFVEVLAVMIMAGVFVLIGTLSVYRGKSAADQLACQDNMRAVHSALQIYWEKNRDANGNHKYPANQTEFTAFLQSRIYFLDGELHCPKDEDRVSHYQYGYTPVANPVPGSVTITCPMTGAGHGSI